MANTAPKRPPRAVKAPGAPAKTTKTAPATKPTKAAARAGAQRLIDAVKRQRWDTLVFVRLADAYVAYGADAALAAAVLGRKLGRDGWLTLPIKGAALAMRRIADAGHAVQAAGMTPEETEDVAGLPLAEAVALPAEDAAPAPTVAAPPVEAAPEAAQDAYAAFLAGKHVRADWQGFEVAPDALPAAMFAFQRQTTLWALRKGRAALFLDCGLGKSLCQLAWAREVCRHTGGNVLILAPLAVAAQTRDEGEKFGIPVTICRTQEDVRPGINITNYEMLAHFDAAAFAGVVLDESGILKNYTGKVKQALVTAFADTPYKLCCTATPAPNDHIELGNHSEFLGIMPSYEMLTRWFINDAKETGVYRLKGHAEADFWRWVASWAVCVRTPSDLGYPDDGFVLPALELRHETVRLDLTVGAEDGQLFRAPTMNATTLHREMRLTAAARAERVAEIVNASDETWVVWCHTDYEADELKQRIPDAIEVRGSMPPHIKEAKLRQFLTGHARILISKPSVAGWGLNMQFCAHVAFVGSSYSFESQYQAIRRVWRFGQQSPVECVMVAGETEGPVLETLRRKMEAHERMSDAMREATREEQDRARLTLDAYAPQVPMRLPAWLTSAGASIAVPGVRVLGQESGRDWQLYHGDCVEVARALPGECIDFSIFSLPFSNLYCYSPSERDLGNSSDDAEFFRHFNYLVPELHRVTRPGRLCAVHCKQLPMYKGRDGMAGLRDFRGDIIRSFTAAGWGFHSEVTIWKDPVLEMQRTKAHGLLYKQLRADSTISRQGMAEYLLLFRRWPRGDAEEALVRPVGHTTEDFPLETWQRYASPVWFDIRQTRVLNTEQARADKDSKHICPLQLDVIDRALELWTNPGDVCFDPFAGLASAGYEALAMGRRFVGSELKAEYVTAATRFLREAERRATAATLWDGMDIDSVATAPDEASALAEVGA